MYNANVKQGRAEDRSIGKQKIMYMGAKCPRRIKWVPRYWPRSYLMCLVSVGVVQNAENVQEKVDEATQRHNGSQSVDSYVEEGLNILEI